MNLQGITLRDFKYVESDVMTFWLAKYLGHRTSDAKVKSEETDVHLLYAREILTRFLRVAKLLEGMVARDGIEPPTPAFSGPRSTN